MNSSAARAFWLALPLLLAAPISAQTGAPAPQVADQSTLSGTVLSFDKKAGTLRIVIESRAGAASPLKADSPFATLAVPPDFAPKTDEIKRGAFVRATGKWDGKGVLKASALQILTAQERLAPPSGHIKAGWPKQTTGAIQSSAVAAQLDGKGPLEVVVAAIGDAQNPGSKMLGAAQLWAWTSEGQRFGEWPLDVQSAAERPDDGSNIWYGSPSVADLDGNEFDEVAMPMPAGKNTQRGFSLFWGDGTRWPTSFGQWDRPDHWNSMPLVDVTGDGTVDLISGNILMTPKGGLPVGWTSKNSVASSYQMVWADLDGDGHLEGFLPRMEKYWHLANAPAARVIDAMDYRGQQLAGWPQQVDGISLYASAGDISGDDDLEVVSVDLGGTLRAWTLDGQGVPGSKTRDDPDGTQTRGALRSGLNGSVPLTLADLDGDGKAEILALTRGGELLTLKGDGTSWGQGTLGRFNGRAGAAVADLGGDGEMDIFVGTKWIRLTPDGPVSADIVPPDVPIVGTPSLCDLEGDGQAEVLLASADGRVWVFETERELKPEWLQWQTASGNFRRNAAWFDPRKITPAIAKWARGRFSPNDAR